MTNYQIQQMLLKKLKHISMDSDIKMDSLEVTLERVRLTHMTVQKAMFGPVFLHTRLQEKLNAI